MRALLWIIIVVLIGWGIWYFVRGNGAAETTSAAPTSQAEANTDYDVDLGDFEAKG